MSRPASFDDQGKNAVDLCDKGYFSESWKVDLTTTSQSGVKFLPNLSQGKDGIAGEMKTKFNYQNMGLTASMNLKDLVTVEATSLKDFNGAKPTLKLTTQAQDFNTLTGKLSVAYNRDRVTSNFALEVPNPSAPIPDPKPENFVAPSKKFFANAMFGGCHGAAAGGSLEVDVESQEVKAYGVAASYTQADSEGSITYKNGAKGVAVAANFHHKAENNRAFAGQLTYVPGQTPVLTVAASTKPDSASSLKARVSSKGNVGLGYTQKMNEFLTVGVKADVNLPKASPTAVNWGVTASFSP